MQSLKKAYHRPVWGPFLVAQLTTRMALPWTRLFLALGLRPNAVSWMAAAVSGLGAVALALEPFPFARAAGASLLILGLLWDHSDGQVARARDLRSASGGLLDSILDRWVEAAWAAALTLGVLLRPESRAATLGVGGAAIAGLACLHGLHYFRYAALARTQTLLQEEIRRSRRPDGTVVLEAPTGAPAGVPRTFGLPFHSGRDAIFWLLFAVSLSSWWDLGLAASGLLLSLRGLEMNHYTFQGLRAGRSKLDEILDLDAH